MCLNGRKSKFARLSEADQLASGSCRKSPAVHDTWQLVRLKRILCDTSLPTRRRRSSDTGCPLPAPGDAGGCPSSSSSRAAATASSCRRACISSSRNIPLMLTSSFADTCAQTNTRQISRIIYHVSDVDSTQEAACRNVSPPSLVCPK